MGSLHMPNSRYYEWASEAAAAKTKEANVMASAIYTVIAATMAGDLEELAALLVAFSESKTRKYEALRKFRN